MANWACVYIADVHGGAKEAVTPEPATPLQETLLQHWDAARADVKREVKGYKFSLNLGGDLIEGNHHDRHTGLTEKEMRERTIRLLMPYANMADAIWSVGGTEAHAGIDGQDDAQIAKELGCPSENMDWHHRIRVDGRIIDWEHHGASISEQAWNETNGLFALTKKLYMNALFAGETPPDFVMRHHFHRVPKGDYVMNWGVMATIGPCWKFRDAYSHRRGLSLPPTIGISIYFPAEHRLKVLRYAIKEEIKDIAARQTPKYRAHAKR